MQPQAYFFVVVACLADAAIVPRHAVGASPSASNWTACADGYFRSASPQAPTCRACAYGGTCALGWRYVPCTRDADAHCERCDAAPLGFSYDRAGDCAHAICADGWWALGDADCVPCPVGMVCPRGAPAAACPGNCTTSAAGASTVLQCDTTTGEGARVRLQWSLFFLSAGVTVNVDACARALDAVFLAWVVYGAYERCELVPQSEAAATLQCSLLAPACIADAYAAWAADAVPDDPIRKALTAASASDVLLGPLGVSYTPTLSTASSSGAAAQRRRPVYAIEGRRWGQQHLENLDTLGLSAAVLLGMCLGVIMACALACTRRHRRRLMRVAFWRQRGAALRAWLRR